MRADMAKVIVERPRKKGFAWNKPKGYQRRLIHYGEDGPPAREGIKACWQNHTKCLNEHLGPLRRYLDKQVGRPWDEVFSEICEHIDRSSAVQDHVRDHVEQYVNRNVLLIDGVPCSGDGDWNHGRPVDEMGWRPWYVCPSTGILRRVKVTTRKRRGRPEKGELPPAYVRVSATSQCRFHDGGWHLVTLKALPGRYQYGPCPAVDVLLKRPVAEIKPGQAREHYGAEVYAAHSRRLGRRELSQYPIPSRWWDMA